MACGGCARRQRKILAFGGWALAKIGRPIPRRALDVMVGVTCHACGFTGDGVAFGWSEVERRGFCVKCNSNDITPGTARLT